jgi:hypothetical protein
MLEAGVLHPGVRQGVVVEEVGAMMGVFQMLYSVIQMRWVLISPIFRHFLEEM